MIAYYTYPDSMLSHCFIFFLKVLPRTKFRRAHPYGLQRNLRAGVTYRDPRGSHERGFRMMAGFPFPGLGLAWAAPREFG